MLSVKGLQKAPGYRYYLEKESPCYWVGEGAKRLGLDGRVTPEQYHHIRLGLHPETGEKLRRITPADRVYTLKRKADDLAYQKTYKACELYDLTLGAPKTVSILNIEDERAHQSHLAGVKESLGAMEAKCGEMVVIRSDHHYSRSLDPHMHTHLVAGNLAWDGAKWRTLHYSNIIKSQDEITAAYRQLMLGELAWSGYQISYPEVAGIAPELVEKFSQRSRYRDELVERHRQRHGIGPQDRVTGKEISVLLADNREPKIGMAYREYLEWQREKLTHAERIALRETVERSYEHAHRHRLRLEVAEGEEHTETHRLRYGQGISM